LIKPSRRDPNIEEYRLKLLKIRSLIKKVAHAYYMLMFEESVFSQL